jgi:hypothetical protein
MENLYRLYVEAAAIQSGIASVDNNVADLWVLISFLLQTGEP